MGMFKKKSSETVQHDSVSIDHAMDELAKQTDALLGHFDDPSSKQNTSEKPVLPKRQAKPMPRGKSFDIIHNPRQKTRINATLKSVKPNEPVAPEIVIDTPEVQLLPDHATKSYNEIPETDTAVIEPSTENEISQLPSIIHHEGRLSVGVPEEDILPVETAPEPVKTNELVVSSASKTLSFTEASEPEEKSTIQEQALDEVADQNEAKKEVEEVQASESSDSVVEVQPVEDTAYTSGELFANNLVKETKPKGFQVPEGSETDVPAVFDTAQYHPELHDWSKLEHKSGSKWLLLILLIVIAGAVAYFIISGQELPF